MPKPKGNRAQALQYIGGLIDEGLTNTEIVRILKNEGLSYRNQTMFADVNQQRLESFGAAQIKNLGFDTPIPERLMRDRYINSPFDYSVVVKYEVTDPVTGLTFETGTTLYFAEAPSQAEALSYFAARSESGLDSAQNQIEYGKATSIYYYRNNQ